MRRRVYRYIKTCEYIHIYIYICIYKPSSTNALHHAHIDPSSTTLAICYVGIHIIYYYRMCHELHTCIIYHIHHIL